MPVNHDHDPDDNDQATAFQQHVEQQNVRYPGYRSAWDQFSRAVLTHGVA